MGWRRWGVLLVAAAVVAFCLVGGAERARGGSVWGVAAAGDSLSTGYASEEQPGEVANDHPRNSWSVGTNPAVDSHYVRLRREAPELAGSPLLVAQDGALVAALPAQLGRVVERGGVGYVTIQVGVNDICDARDPSRITPVSVVRREVRRALELLQQGAPDTRVLVTSLADEARWNDAVLQLPGLAKQIEDGTVCDPRPGPDGRQSPAARALIQHYEQQYNKALAAVCASFLLCRYDRGALSRLGYTPADVSRHDGEHPSIAGLQKIAAVTWAASFDFADRTPPRASAALTPTTDGSLVTLQASDLDGVRGIRYRLNGGPYQTYTRPLRLPHGSRLSYQAVDMNGNVSATQLSVG